MLGHIICGFLLFLAFGVASVGTSLLVHFFETLDGLSPFTLGVLKIVDGGVLIAEALLYLACVVITAWSLFKEMLK